MDKINSEVIGIIDILKKQLKIYNEIQYLGEGSTSYCFNAEHTHLGSRVIKVAIPSLLEKNKELRDIFLEEIGILSKIHHKNVVVIFDIGEVAGDGLNIPYYVMEYFSYDLRKYIQSDRYIKIDREQFIHIIRQAAEGLFSIHKHVSHNDIKESNIFIDDDLNVKIGDFGFAKPFSLSSSPDTQHGSPEYWCKELKSYLKRKSQENPSNTVIIVKKKDRKPKWDIFALGIIFENMLQKYLEIRPKDGLDNDDRRYICQLIENMKLENEDGINTSAEVVDAIDKMRKTLWTSLVVPELTSQPRRTTLRIPEQETIYISDNVNVLVNHPWFQRLKNIRQLGLAYLVYPGAMHTRLEHSLGVYNKTILYLNGLLADTYNPFFRMNMDSYKAKVLLLSALLHDIGHYPFAHSFEEISKEYSHLNFTIKFIDGSIINLAPELIRMDELSNLSFNKIIEEKWKVNIKDIIGVLKKGEKAEHIDETLCKLFNYILDSPIDVDKIDYIIRDSLHVGVSYGKYFDFNRFLQGVTINEKSGDGIVLLEKAKVPVEMLLMIRYAMYKDVYRHHAVRVAEAMLSHAVYFLYKSKTEYFIDEKNKKELFNKLFSSSDDQLIEWLYENGPIETKRLIDNIKNRKLFKRLVVYRKGDEKTGPIHENITNMKWRKSEDRREFVEFCSCLRRKLNEQFGVDIEEYEMVIDVPNPEKDKIQDVSIIPEYSTSPVSLLNQSDIFGMIKGNFQKWVHKIRIFLEEKKRDIIYDKVKIKVTEEEEQINFDKINKIVDESINKAWV
jgi:HD superfamily phosphohydrolase